MNGPEVKEAVRQAAAYVHNLQRFQGDTAPSDSDPQKKFFAEALIDLANRIPVGETMVLLLEKDTAHVKLSSIIRMARDKQATRDAVKRKRSLKPSERAMWLAELEEQIEMLEAFRKQLDVQLFKQPK